ncbi:hypothetical protein QVD17_28981 [Tagetes erecta]|uniref:non-specific serine/threonine protein kinase n=1 Tax=Tagetes erecta TaxID=13708 RepID=A0AAD8KB85_TARER|nr:hypothetical protein QVD17_28981 [Tagetes erecta]
MSKTAMTMIYITSNELADVKVASSVSMKRFSSQRADVAHSFTFPELAIATQNFKDDNLIGEGGFGSVYKGRLESGKIVAVKQLNLNGGQGNQEFIVEVLMLSLLRHSNLVTLTGYCAAGDQRLLVYEFMPQGSLENHLFDLEPDQQPLDWHTRLKVAVGAARGLEYLHCKANPPVIYRDLKSSNILLDNDFSPKLSDFGLAKLGPVGDNTHVSTRVMGTYGYCAPEYAMSGKLTIKSDIYSFGVVMLELITGRRAIDTTKKPGEQNLVPWACPFLRDRKKFVKLVDPLLHGRFSARSVHNVVAITAMCLQEQANFRPLISDIVVALEYLASQAETFENRKSLLGIYENVDGPWSVMATSSSIAINQATTPVFVFKAQSSTPTPTQVPAPAPKTVGDYIPLCRAIRMGEWEKAEAFFNDDKNALTDKINSNGDTSLHIAVGDPKDIWFLEKLLEKIDPKLITTMLNNKDQTALHHAAILDNTKAAIKLVEKNPCVLFIVDRQNHLPIQKAIFNSHKTTFLYLLHACKQHIHLTQKEGHHNPFEGVKGVYILNNAILSDVAYNLLKKHPDLARPMDDVTQAPLFIIAKKWDAYLSAKRYNFYERFIYNYVSLEDYYALDDTHKISDVENQQTDRTNNLTRIYIKFWKIAVQHCKKMPHIKQIQKDKREHKTALMVLKLICKEVGELKVRHKRHYGEAIIAAVRNDTPEVVRHIVQTFPQSIWIAETTFSQLSIMNRSEKVYNFLVHEVTHEKYFHTISKDKQGNNLLHLAGKLAPPDKLHMVTGAALQMQREFQWFQEVRKFIRPKDREAKNDEQETPITVFRKEHKDLRKEGEEWMKKTADSYTITAALIITIVFAAAITVPGGNNGDSGKPILESNPGFVVFVVSDAISLFTSTTSLLFFLSILTARYAEEDFLYKLPKRLIFGLVMLFVSVTTMMIAFTATLYISFGQGKSWILLPIAALACLPIAAFVTLQLPLLVDLISSTYGHGIFGKRSELRITS